MSARARRALCRIRGHEWRYHGAIEPYTGYFERCERCGALLQVPQ